MVAVSILAILIVIFGGILSQVQRVISLSNEAIRIDRTVAALDKLIRRDVSSINKGGFLKITEGNQIAFTGVGSFESKMSPGQTANAAIIDYGRLGGSNVLWRRQHLLKPELDADTGDMLKASVAESTTVESSEYTDDAVITLPPTSAADWMNYVAGNCTDFRVSWWNGADWSAEDGSGSWTAANPDNWPEALRVRFRLEDKVFEVIAKIE